MTSIRREVLAEMTQRDVELEAVPMFDQDGRRRFCEWFATGLPTREAWVSWFASEMGITPYDEVTRIQWRYLERADG